MVIIASAFFYANAENKCESIPKYKLQTNLYLNPPGYQTYYDRSYCFFHLAVDEREPKFCSNVKRHYALFLDGSHFTRKNCESKVAQKISEDKAYTEQFKGKHHTIQEAYLTLDGNEKDFDFIIKVSGDARVCYKMELIITYNDKTLGTLYSEPRTFYDDTTELRLYIPRQDLLKVLKNEPINRTYKVKLLLTKYLDPFTSKYLDKENNSIETYMDVNFSKLTWKPEIMQ